MRAGRLRHLVRFERKALDGAGIRTGAWEPALEGPVPADIVFLRAGETVVGQRLEGKRPAIITIRGCELTRQIDNAWRCVDARVGTTFNIQGVTPSTRGDQLDIVAVAGGAHG